VGESCALLAATKELGDIVLIDVMEDMPKGKALDILEGSPVEQFDVSVAGSGDPASLSGADVVIVTAGSARKPGMTRDDLLLTNAKIVVGAAKEAIAHSPDAILIIVTNPLDVLTYLSWQATGLPTHRVMGMAGILDSSRFQTFISMELGVSMADVRAMVLGCHGDLMVPLPEYSTVSGIPITKFMDTATIERLVERTRNGGAEVVGHLKTGGAYYAPSASVCQMIESILNDKSRLLPIASYLDGQYGLKDVFIGVPTRLGKGGVESIVELVLSDQQQSALHVSAQSVKSNIDKAIAMLGL
jgi:malate dehydrogenase